MLGASTAPLGLRSLGRPEAPSGWSLHRDSSARDGPPALAASRFGPASRGIPGRLVSGALGIERIPRPGGPVRSESPRSGRPASPWIRWPSLLAFAAVAYGLRDDPA